MDIEENLAVRCHTGKQAGLLELSVIPFKDGEILDDDLVEDPHELLGKDYQFQINLKTICDIPNNIVKVSVWEVQKLCEFNNFFYVIVTA